MRRLLLLLLSLTLCAHAGAQECQTEEPENFNLFLYRFTGDKAFAVGRSLYPLSVVEYRHGVDGMDARPLKQSLLAREEDEKLPTIEALIRENGLVSQVLAADFRAAVVEIYKDGADRATSYHFRRRGRCWYLHEVRNHY